MTDEELRWLKARGQPSTVLRDLIAEARRPPLPIGESLGYRPPTFVWMDGTANWGNFTTGDVAA